MAVIGFTCGFMFTLMGIVMYLAPPANINNFYGYRMPSSQRSQERWDFAQRYSALRGIEAGIALLVITWISGYINIANKWDDALGFVFLIMVCIYMIGRTEYALKKKFPKS